MPRLKLGAVLPTPASVNGLLGGTSAGLQHQSKLLRASGAVASTTALQATPVAVLGTDPGAAGLGSSAGAGDGDADADNSADDASVSGRTGRGRGGRGRGRGWRRGLRGTRGRGRGRGSRTRGRGRGRGRGGSRARARGRGGSRAMAPLEDDDREPVAPELRDGPVAKGPALLPSFSLRDALNDLSGRSNPWEWGVVTSHAHGQWLVEFPNSAYFYPDPTFERAVAEVVAAFACGGLLRITAADRPLTGVDPLPVPPQCVPHLQYLFAPVVTPRTVLITDRTCFTHAMPRHHPEGAARLNACLRRLSRLLPDLNSRDGALQLHLTAYAAASGYVAAARAQYPAAAWQHTYGPCCTVQPPGAALVAQAGTALSRCQWLPTLPAWEVLRIVHDESYLVRCVGGCCTPSLVSSRCLLFCVCALPVGCVCVCVMVVCASLAGSRRAQSCRRRAAAHRSSGVHAQRTCEQPRARGRCSSCRRRRGRRPAGCHG